MLKSLVASCAIIACGSAMAQSPKPMQATASPPCLLWVFSCPQNIPVKPQSPAAKPREDSAPIGKTTAPPELKKTPVVAAAPKITPPSPAKEPSLGKDVVAIPKKANFAPPRSVLLPSILTFHVPPIDQTDSIDQLRRCLARYDTSDAESLKKSEGYVNCTVVLSTRVTLAMRFLSSCETTTCLSIVIASHWCPKHDMVYDKDATQPGCEMPKGKE